MSPGAFVLNCIFSLIFWPAAVLLLAGDWLWLEGWLFGLWMSAMILSVLVYTYFQDPALLAERTRRPGSGNQKAWDKYLLVGILLTAIIWLIVMPLDAKRFAWSPPFPVWLKAIGGLALLPALYLIFQSTAANTFMSTAVRVQAERKQRVISTGVYGLVRHPLYLGCVFLLFGAPLLLGSVIGLIISLIGAVSLVVRIIGEEKMLTEELEGYAEYRQKVKYRLIPFLW